MIRIHEVRRTAIHGRGLADRTIDLARRIRRDPGNSRTPLVALSGYGQDADIQVSLAAGLDEHPTKPSDPERLEPLQKG